MDLVEIYRSHWRPACEERAFVLHAVGIASEIAWDGRSWVLWVTAEHEAAARAQLARYEAENPPRRRPPPPEPLHRGAWLGSFGYAAVILLVAYLAGGDALGRDWLEAGAQGPELVTHGEIWRAITALTLHLDVGHLLANLGFGTVFGLFAGQLLGPGVAWVTVLLAAAAANSLGSIVLPATHSSVGASTAVFATLGLLAAYAWRRRSAEGGRWAYRWAPLVAGVILLGFTGAGGERTDVFAHLAGFGMGAVAGVAHAAWRVPRGLPAQWIAGLATLALVGSAWAWAIARA